MSKVSERPRPDAAVMARVKKQARLDAEGLPRALYRIEDV